MNRTRCQSALIFTTATWCLRQYIFLNQHYKISLFQSIKSTLWKLNQWASLFLEVLWQISIHKCVRSFMYILISLALKIPRTQSKTQASVWKFKWFYQRFLITTNKWEICHQSVALKIDDPKVFCIYVMWSFKPHNLLRSVMLLSLFSHHL